MARECKVSGAAIHQRIQRLTKMGVITGSEFVISPKKSASTPVPMWGFSSIPLPCIPKLSISCAISPKSPSAITSPEAIPSSSRFSPVTTKT
ncbi:MAG: hypothetical protein R2751_15055 [Bacteroidales bacterium]